MTSNINTLLPFEQRLKMAQATIEAHLNRAKPSSRQVLMNGLWARWINHHVLCNKAEMQGVRS